MNIYTFLLFIGLLTLPPFCHSWPGIDLKKITINNITEDLPCHFAYKDNEKENHLDNVLFFNNNINDGLTLIENKNLVFCKNIEDIVENNYVFIADYHPQTVISSSTISIIIFGTKDPYSAKRIKDSIPTLFLEKNSKNSNLRTLTINNKTMPLADHVLYQARKNKNHLSQFLFVRYRDFMMHNALPGKNIEIRMRKAIEEANIRDIATDNYIFLSAEEEDLPINFIILGIKNTPDIQQLISDYHLMKHIQAAEKEYID